MIPLLFGVQQLTEGVIWVTLGHDAPLLKQTMTYVYSGFSHVLWPMYLPFAVGLLEAVRWRRRTLYASPHFYLLPVMVLYVAATCVSCFFSSHGFVRLFGVLALLSFVSAYLVQVGALVSIWCFFAAILSVLIYVHLRFRSLGGFPTGSVSRRGGAAHRA